MNKRKEPTTAREARKSRNEVRRGMKEETPSPQKTVRVTNATKSAVVKKQSRKTSPKEKIQGLTHFHDPEKEHWLLALSRQTLLKAQNFTRKLAKKHSKAPSSTRGPTKKH